MSSIANIVKNDLLVLKLGIILDCEVEVAVRWVSLSGGLKTTGYYAKASRPPDEFHVEGWEWLSFRG